MCQTNPGNADLPMGRFRHANQEIGVPVGSDHAILAPGKDVGVRTRSLAKAESQAGEPPLKSIKLSIKRGSSGTKNVVGILAIGDIQ
jgi:hypothetical protein